MIRFAKILLPCFLLPLLTGCWDQLELEKQSLSLIYAYDIDKNDQLIVYQINPNFSTSAKKKYEVYGSKVDTTQQAKQMFNATSNGIVSTGKVQMILFSEKLLKKEGTLPKITDEIYRDTMNSGTMSLVAVKGSIASIMNSEFNDKPMLPEYLTNLLDVNKSYNNTTFTRIQEFHRQFFDRGITPVISEIKKGKNGLFVTGSALLTKRGVYKMSLNRQESAWLLMLQKKANLPVSLSIRIPAASLKKIHVSKNTKTPDFVTVNVSSIGSHLTTHFTENHFVFHVKMNLSLSIVERTFDMDMKKNTDKLVGILNEQIGKEVNGLLKKVQKQQLDPFGFGDYARGYEYQQWKKVEDNWPSEFSKATVTVTPTVKILNYGVTD